MKKAKKNLIKLELFLKKIEQIKKIENGNKKNKSINAQRC